MEIYTYVGTSQVLRRCPEVPSSCVLMIVLVTLPAIFRVPNDTASCITRTYPELQILTYTLRF